MKNKTILSDVDTASDDYLNKVRELSPAKRKEEMEKIQKMFKRAKAHGEDKVSVWELNLLQLLQPLINILWEGVVEVVAVVCCCCWGVD